MRPRAGCIDDTRIDHGHITARAANIARTANVERSRCLACTCCLTGNRKDRATIPAAAAQALSKDAVGVDTSCHDLTCADLARKCFIVYVDIAANAALPTGSTDIECIALARALCAERAEDQIEQQAACAAAAANTIGADADGFRTFGINHSLIEDIDRAACAATIAGAADIDVYCLV